MAICAQFANCTREATVNLPHPFIVEGVPCCDECLARVAADMLTVAAASEWELSW